MISDRTAATVALRECAEVGPKTFQMLVMQFGPPEELFNRSAVEISKLPRLNHEKAARLLECGKMLDAVRNRLEGLLAHGIRAVTYFDEAYPESLRSISSPPPFFYVRGTLPDEARAVAVVGSHRASTDGIADAVAIGKQLAEEGVAVISGLARGIDAGAHVGAIAGGGKTYAVVGCGLKNISPRENRPLAEQIELHGGLLSECPIDAKGSVPRLLARNRIVVGLAQAVVIVELLAKSKGTMAAVDIALKQGKPVFVVATDESNGVQELVARGAYPITDPASLEAVMAYV